MGAVWGELARLPGFRREAQNSAALVLTKRTSAATAIDAGAIENDGVVTVRHYTEGNAATRRLRHAGVAQSEIRR